MEVEVEVRAVGALMEDGGISLTPLLAPIYSRCQSRLFEVEQAFEQTHSYSRTVARYTQKEQNLRNEANTLAM